MKRRGFVKALAGLVALPSLAWAGAKQLEPVKTWPGSTYLGPVDEPPGEVYGRGPGFEALDDMNYAQEFARAAGKQMDRAIIDALKGKPHLYKDHAAAKPWQETWGAY